VSSAFINANFIFAYLSVVLLVPYYLAPEGHPIEVASGIVDFISFILILVWSFKVRNRLNTLLKTRSGYPSWFHGFWTFLFEHLYINYKINVLCKDTANRVSEGFSPC
jgi:hypothetical protein